MFSQELVPFLLLACLDGLVLALEAQLLLQVHPLRRSFEAVCVPPTYIKVIMEG